ncbi:metaxin-3 isoform X2 [Castor canadensis]|uniref:Metaxin-3 isoform X2 n=1 Tax=Castor canadensis TaxID=51338 RepID=A0A8B7WBY6_CASCN|nr:metaxin-3 isoform X3 [Castor canadensis]
MAAPLELSCWGGGWGLPSVHSESLVVMAYAKFSGAPLKVTVIDSTWRGSRGDVPILTTEDNIVSQPAKILNFLRKQKYNADYELSGKQGADTLAYIALLEEKLLPAVIYRDAKECLNLLSNRLGTSQFFFGDTPSTLDAYVFGFLAPLYKVRFPKVLLQEHLKQLSNLCRFCDEILHSYFRLSLGGISPAGQETVDANLQKLTQLVNKESNLIEKMDDNLRQSPQLPPRKLPTLKLTPAEEDSTSLHRLSP